MEGAATVAAVSPRTLPALVAAALLAALAGCGGTSGPSAGSTPSASPAEPSPARQQAAAEASADPARATDVRSAGLAAALRAADLPAGWSVQANPVPDTADLGTAPSLAGICGGSFPSEAHRTVKYPVVGLDPQRTPLVESEAIGYDGAASAAAALQELRAAFAHCPTEDRTILAPPRVEGLAADAVVVEYQLTGGTTQEVLAQRRGAVVSVLLAEDEDAAAAAARRIAGRLAALPATAAGG
jgi:predicted small lipoprotein YifL